MDRHVKAEGGKGAKQNPIWYVRKKGREQVLPKEWRVGNWEESKRWGKQKGGCGCMCWSWKKKKDGWVQAKPTSNSLGVGKRHLVCKRLHPHAFNAKMTRDRIWLMGVSTWRDDAPLATYLPILSFLFGWISMCSENGASSILYKRKKKKRCSFEI